MRPWHIVDEAGEKLRGGDRAGRTAARVLDVGEAAVDLFVVGGAHGQAPEFFAGGEASGQQPGRQVIVIGEKSRVIAAERHADGAREGREIDHELRLEPVLGVPERVGENQAPLGVGVDDLDGGTAHRGEDIAGTIGGARGHVLDQPDHADGVDLGLAGGQRVHQPGDGRGAAHIALHVFHAEARLQRDAAGIEHHALADEGDRLLLCLAAVPAHDDEARRAGRALRHAEQGVHAELAHGLLVELLDLDTQLGKLGGLGGELQRAQHIGRQVDQIARQQRAFGGRLPVGDGLVDRRLAIDVQGHRKGAVGAVVGLFGLVGVELVVPEAQAGGEFGHLFGRHAGFIEQHRDLVGLEIGQLAGERTTPIGPGGEAAPLPGLAAAEHQQAICLDAGGRQQVDDLALLALEVRRCGDPRPI